MHITISGYEAFGLVILAVWKMLDIVAICVRHIKEAQPLMRKDDPSYAAARFAGFCASKIPGTSGIGLIDAIDLSADLRDITHGDAGVYVVDVSTGKVEAGGGYGKPFKLDPSKFPD